MRRDTPPAYDTYPWMGPATPAYDIYPDHVYAYVDAVGELFSWGLAGGAAHHFNKGFRGSPASGGARLAAGINAVLHNAPGIAGKLGAFCVLWFTIDNAVSLASGRDDDFTAAAAFAATCGLHGMRRGGAPTAKWYTILGATGYLGMDYATRAWEIGWVKEMDRELNRRKPVPVDRPETGRGSPLSLRTLASLWSKQGKERYVTLHGLLNLFPVCNFRSCLERGNFLLFLRFSLRNSTFQTGLYCLET